MQHAHPNLTTRHTPDLPFLNSDKVLLGAGVAAGTMLAPTILPFLGIGSAALAEETVNVMHGTGVGTGLAGGINSLLEAIPGIGDTLVAGGAPAAAIVATIGIGGYLLGKFIEKRDHHYAPMLGKMIRYASLATSALFALPSALTAISIGIVYTATALFGPGFASGIMGMLQSTLGVTGEASVSSIGLTGVAATIPHLLTCGASVAPAALSFALDRNEDASAQKINPYHLNIHTDTIPKPGAPCEALVTITDQNGNRLKAEDLAIIHTQKLHLFLVDDSLRDYQHIHPQPTAEPGVFSFTFLPRTSNAYNAWAECVPQAKKSLVSTHARLAHHLSLMPPTVKPITKPMQDGLHFHWEQPGQLQKNNTATVEIEVRDKNGMPFSDLEPVMGAYAHLVGFSADRKHMVHCHPLGAEPKNKNERGGPKLRFHVTPTFDGPAQFFLQVKKDGQDVFVPFAERIRASGKMADKIAPASAQQGLAY